jgi:hypothetical protein
MPQIPLALITCRVARSEWEGLGVQTGVTLLRSPASTDNEPTFGTILCSDILLHLSVAGRQVILCRKLLLDESDDVLDGS